MTDAEYRAAIAEVRASVAASQRDLELQERRKAEPRREWSRRVRGDWATDPNIGKD